MGFTWPESGGGSAGIAALKLIGSAAGAQRLLDQTGEPWTTLLWDSALIVVYSLGLVAAVHLVFPLFRLRSLRKAARPASAAALAPGVLDLVANVLLVVAITRPTWTDGWFLAVATLAFAKFLLTAVLLGAILVGVASGLTTHDEHYHRLAKENEAAAVPSAAMPAGRRLGIALSGGGVRAASLSLGALQELERADRLGWDDAEVITAVSGGAYMGGAWQLGRHGCDSGNANAWRREWLDADGIPNRTGTPGAEEQHLLNNLGYLTSPWPRGQHNDTGAGNAHSGAEDPVATRMRNSASFWVTLLVGFGVNLVVLSAAVVAAVIPVALALEWLIGLAGRCATTASGATQGLCLVQQPGVWVPPVGWLAMGLILAFGWVTAGKLPGIRTRTSLLAALRVMTFASFGLAGAQAFVLVGFPLIVVAVDAASPGAIAAMAAALVTMAGSVVRILQKQVLALAPKLGGVAFVVLFLAGAGLVAGVVWTRWPVTTSWSVFGGLTLFLVLIWYCCSPELWSMFAFYRGKLRSAYALHRDKNIKNRARPYVNDADRDPALDYRQEPQLSEIADSRLTICSAVHASTKAVRTHYRIPAMSLTWSPRELSMFVPQDDQGRASRYACSMTALENVYQGAGLGLTTRRLTTMFAVALSAAAVSPAMGRFRIGPTSLLITFANVRLGSWLPNPRYITDADSLPRPVRRFPVVRLGYLFKEFFGIHDPTDLFVYVSDGGHWENSGLVELLRGQPVAEPAAAGNGNGQHKSEPAYQVPNEIILVDADAGHAVSVLQLAQAIDLAKLECDVDIFVDLEKLRAFPSGEGGPCFAERSVALGVVRKQDRWGLLWYAKPALTMDSPAPLLSHREFDSEFPATTTLNQFFDTATYFAYRDLGRHNAALIKTARRELRAYFASTPRLENWLERDGNGQLESEHWAIREFARLLRHQSNQLNGRSMSGQQALFDDVQAMLFDAPKQPPRVQFAMPVTVS